MLTVTDRLAILKREEEMLRQERQREEQEEMELVAPSIKLLFDKLTRSKNAYWSLGELHRVEIEYDFNSNDPIHQTSVRIMTKLLNVEISRPENVYLGYPPAIACWYWEIEMGCCRKPKGMITVQFNGRLPFDLSM